MLNRCENCVFYGTSTRTCDYLYHTGTPRITICEPGNECTVFKAKSGKRTKWDVVKAYHLYMEGKSWQEIATAVGVSRDKVYAYGCKYWPKRTKTEEAKQEMKEETEVRKNYTDIPAENNAPIPVPPSPAVKEGVSPAVKAEAAPAAKPVVIQTPVTMLDLLELAIGDRQGVDAYLTGEAVSRLINWRDKTDLEQARDAIKLLILRLQ